MRHRPFTAALGMVLLSGGFVVACTSSKTSTTPAHGGAASSTSQQPPSSAPPASSSARVAGVGDAIDISGQSSGVKLEVTLVRVVDPDSSNNQFEQPSSGDRYESVQFRIVNTGTGTYQDDPQIDVSAKDSAGQNLQLALTADTTAGPQMPSNVNLTSGDKALGYMTFDVPTGDKIATVQYSLNGGFYGNAGQWKLS